MSDVIDLTKTADTRRALIIPGRYYNDDDVTPELQAEAERWLENYDGDNKFLSDVQASMEDFGHLTKRQARAVLNFISNELKDREPRRGNRHDEVTSVYSQAQLVAPAKFEQTKRSPAVKVPPVGTYTIIWPDDSHTTLRVVEPGPTFKVDPGTMIVEYLSGPDNEDDYTPFAFAKTTGAFPWQRYRDNIRLCNALQRLMTAPEDAGYAYAIRSGKCYRCGRKLTVPASVHRGLGPTCALKV